MRIGAGLTSLSQRFVDIPRERFGLFGAFASGPIGFEGSLGHIGWIVGPPDMKEKTNQDESDQYKLVKPHSSGVCGKGVTPSYDA